MQRTYEAVRGLRNRFTEAKILMIPSFAAGRASGAGPGERRSGIPWDNGHMGERSDASVTSADSLEQWSARRRSRIVAHRAKSFAEAERWDLEYWQSRTPEERLSALVHIRHDVELAQAARRADREPSD